MALLHYNRAFELNRIDLENFIEKIDFDLSLEDFELGSHVLYSQTLIDALKIEFYPKQSDLRNLLTLKKFNIFRFFCHDLFLIHI